MVYFTVTPGMLHMREFPKHQPPKALRKVVCKRLHVFDCTNSNLAAIFACLHPFVTSNLINYHPPTAQRLHPHSPLQLCFVFLLPMVAAAPRLFCKHVHILISHNIS